MLHLCSSTYIRAANFFKIRQSQKLTVNMASAFLDSEMAPGGWSPPPEDLGNYNRHDYEIFTRIWYHQGVIKLKRNFDITGPVCKLQTQTLKKYRFWEIYFLGMLTSRNFEALSILKISDRYLKDWLFYRTFCKMPKKLVFKIQNGP